MELHNLDVMKARADQVLDTLQAIIKTHNSITCQYLGYRLAELEQRIDALERGTLDVASRLNKAADCVSQLKQEAKGNGKIH